MTPENITNYDMTDRELEAFLIFCVLVAGKNADTTSRQLGNMFQDFEDEGWWRYLDALGSVDDLPSLLRGYRFGCYNAKAKTLKQLSLARLANRHWSQDLRICTPDFLEQFTGIGPKTSRFFILHSRKDVNNISVLDTHILAWLREKGHKVPRSTPPSGKKYKEVEDLFLKEAEKFGKTVAQLDLEIWTARHVKVGETKETK